MINELLRNPATTSYLVRRLYRKLLEEGFDHDAALRVTLAILKQGNG